MRVEGLSANKTSHFSVILEVSSQPWLSMITYLCLFHGFYEAKEKKSLKKTISSVWLISITMRKTERKKNRVKVVLKF